MMPANNCVRFSGITKQERLHNSPIKFTGLYRLMDGETPAAKKNPVQARQIARGVISQLQALIIGFQDSLGLKPAPDIFCGVMIQERGIEKEPYIATGKDVNHPDWKNAQQIDIRDLINPKLLEDIKVDS